MIKFNTPKGNKSFALNSTNPVIQQMVIDTLRDNGIKVCSLTNKFDPTYPYLCWSSNRLTQTFSNSDLLGLEEFMDMFTKDNTIEVTLNDKYKAVVHTDKVVVGCQTFSHDAVMQLVDAIKTIK